MPEKRLEREFFMTDALTLSKRLLGMVLVHETPCGTARGVITETEAYMGVDDKGSHTYGGLRTERTEPMFHIGGTSYVYLIYGMYCCMNITAGEADVPEASLIRMVEPLDGESRAVMERLRWEEAERKRLGRRLRGEGLSKEEIRKRQEEITLPDHMPAALRRHLADGPGKLCTAMGITRKDNDVDLTASPRFYLLRGSAPDASRIREGKRIGIDYAEEAADYLWRFTLV